MLCFVQSVKTVNNINLCLQFLLLHDCCCYVNKCELWTEQRRYIRRVHAAVIEGEVSDEEVSRTRQSHRQLHVNVI